MAAWAGLGYYSRARNLLACARAVAARPGGALSRDSAAELARCPASAATPSAAIAAIAFDEPVAVDRRQRRARRRPAVRHRHAAAGGQAADPRAACSRWSRHDRAGEFAEALMDLGATICTPRKPGLRALSLERSLHRAPRGRQSRIPARRRPKAEARPHRHRLRGATRRRRDPAPPAPAARPARRHERSAGRRMGAKPTQAPATAPLRRRLERRSPRRCAHAFTHFELVLEVRACRRSIETLPAPAGHWWAPAAIACRTKRCRAS